jgi:hypothetical protein
MMAENRVQPASCCRKNSSPLTRSGSVVFGRDGWESKGEQSRARAWGCSAYTRRVGGGQSQDPRLLRGGRSLLAERGMRRGDNFIRWGISLRARLGTNMGRKARPRYPPRVPRRRGWRRHDAMDPHIMTPWRRGPTRQRGECFTCVHDLNH